MINSYLYKYKKEYFYNKKNKLLQNSLFIHNLFITLKIVFLGFTK